MWPAARKHPPMRKFREGQRVLVIDDCIDPGLIGSYGKVTEICDRAPRMFRVTLLGRVDGRELYLPDGFDEYPFLETELEAVD
jgi:hypoxanthine-guanine phosphoribosyltransferase